jgi:hypothetical protein
VSHELAALAPVVLRLDVPLVRAVRVRLEVAAAQEPQSNDQHAAAQLGVSAQLN